MPDSTESRLARIEEQLRTIHEDLHEQREAGKTDHHRLRSVEQAVALLVNSAMDDARFVESGRRRIELRMQVLTAVVAFAALVEPFLYAIAHR